MAVSLGNHKLLVVDNEPLVVEELVEYLVGRGYVCIGCADSEEALQYFRGMPEIDIVLSDFRMPGMNGVQLVEAMRTQCGASRVFEAIIFTGNAEKDDVIDALRAGVADYYQKPLDLNLLHEGLGRVAERLEKRAAESKLKMLSHNLQALSTSLSAICEGMSGVEDGGDRGVAAGSAPSADNTHRSNAKLSPRQKDVAILVSQGYTNYQIACELGISENTVKIYVSQILRIFNFSNRTQLALALGRRPPDF